MTSHFVRSITEIANSLWSPVHASSGKALSLYIPGIWLLSMYHKNREEEWKQWAKIEKETLCRIHHVCLFFHFPFLSYEPTTGVHDSCVGSILTHFPDPSSEFTSWDSTKWSNPKGSKTIWGSRDPLRSGDWLSSSFVLLMGVGIRRPVSTRQHGTLSVGGVKLGFRHLFQAGWENPVN